MLNLQNYTKKMFWNIKSGIEKFYYSALIVPFDASKADFWSGSQDLWNHRYYGVKFQKSNVYGLAGSKYPVSGN